MRFEQFLANGVAECTYMLSVDAAYTCEVIDPRPNVDIYAETARRFGMAITNVFKTHIQADFLCSSFCR